MNQSDKELELLKETGKGNIQCAKELIKNYKISMLYSCLKNNEPSENVKLLDEIFYILDEYKDISEEKFDIRVYKIYSIGLTTMIYGYKGMPKNEEYGIKLVECAANNGCIDAMLWLGERYIMTSKRKKIVYKAQKMLNFIEKNCKDKNVLNDLLDCYSRLSYYFTVRSIKELLNKNEELAEKFDKISDLYKRKEQDVEKTLKKRKIFQKEYKQNLIKC